MAVLPVGQKEVFRAKMKKSGQWLYMLGRLFLQELFVSLTRNTVFSLSIFKIPKDYGGQKGISTCSQCATNTLSFSQQTSGFIKQTFYICLYQREKHGGQILRSSRYYSKPNFCWKNLWNYEVIRRFHTHDKVNFLG